MTRGAVQHNEQMMLRVGFGELFEECLQTSAIHPRQVMAEALSRGGLESRIEVSPLVGAPHHVGRAKAFGTVAPPVPVDQSPKRASSKARTFSGFPGRRSRLCPTASAKFFCRPPALRGRPSRGEAFPS